MDVAGLVLAMGSERGRLGPSLDALCPLDGVPLIAHAVRALDRSDAVGMVAVSVPSGSSDRIRRALDRYVPGHRATIFDAFDSGALVGLCRAARYVVVSDCRHPLAPPELVDRVLAAVRQGADLAVPTVGVTETVKELDPDGWIVRTVARETLCQVQAPWALRAEIGARLGTGVTTGIGAENGVDTGTSTLGGLFAGLRATADLPGLVSRLGECRLATVAGHPDAFALDTPADLELASAVLRARRTAEPHPVLG